ncbi:4-O-dimethylallyl-L-tyrosine synthase [Cytospora mali]|uniref:4-O-dimethylallyl-L-tyrosine synthase n=1 Tax=Cytospora mali TaxID=578113 RepID=A0A194W5Y8_CYTMA|nr:4-O-dimethylallyl-L-tyrosine synthase [Valsa mali]
MSSAMSVQTLNHHQHGAISHHHVHHIGAQTPNNARPTNSVVWETLVRWLSSRDSDSDWWWKTTGKQLVTILADGGYNLNQQYEALLFHHQAVVSRLGPKPISIQPQWRSFMTDDYSPIEYSWKWGMGSDPPDVRYGIEAIGSKAGTMLDPLNQIATRDLVHQLSLSMPDLDLSWFHHFNRALFGPGSPMASSPKLAGSSTMFLAFEMVRSQMSVKAYFIPMDTPEMSAADQILAAIKAAGYSHLDAIAKMESYLLNDAHGSTLTPFMIGIDCVNPCQSRLKIYVRSPRTSFDFVRNVMTLGGLRSGLDDVAEQFHDLWKLTLDLDPSFPSSEELPNRQHTTSGTCFYFDVAPHSSVPDVKAYIPVRHYAKSDRQVGQGLIKFLEKHGRADYAQKYMHAVESLATTDGIDASTGIQTYVSCAYQKNQVSMTSYLSPQMYHPARWSSPLHS